MIRRLLACIIFPTLVSIFAPIEAISSTSEVEFALKGVLISPIGHSALINGRVVNEGEQVNGITILDIHETGVRVLSGNQEYTVRIGASVRLARSAKQYRQKASAPDTAVAKHLHTAGAEAKESGNSVRAVVKGDTLSGIAQDYARDGVGLNQVMVALFETNPSAFKGNINRLMAGAVLQIPQLASIRNYSVENAMAEVQRQTDEWQAPMRHAETMAAKASRRADTSETEVTATLETFEYGPVQFGETLSEIAVEVGGKEQSMTQMMVVLFESNPDAFGNNMDVLYEGAILRIPGPDLAALKPLVPVTASNL